MPSPPLYLTWILTLSVTGERNILFVNLASQGSDGWQPQAQGEPQFSTWFLWPGQWSMCTTSREIIESKPERLNFLPNQGARKRPKWQPFPHLCCEWVRRLDFSILFLLWEATLSMAQEGLLTLSVSILDNAYKGQCLSSPPWFFHPITFITSWVSAGLLSGLFLLYSISHSCQLLLFNTYFVAVGNGKEKKKRDAMFWLEKTCVSQHGLYPSEVVFRANLHICIRFAYLKGYLGSEGIKSKPWV